MKPDSGDYTGLYIGSVHPEDVSGLGNGIYYFARESMDNGKLWDVDEASLDTVRNAMDVLLIEADGSKCKPSIFPLCIPQVMKWKQTAFTLS